MTAADPPGPPAHDRAADPPGPRVPDGAAQPDRTARPDGPHPDLDTLADLDAGLLDPAAAERLSAHLAGCTRCSRAAGALVAVRAELHALPAPPLPAAVSARLDATVAQVARTEPPGSTASGVNGSAPAGMAQPDDRSDGNGPPGGRSVGGLSAARARRRRRLGLSSGAIAAAFALVAAAASVTALVQYTGGSDGVSSGASVQSEGRGGAAPSAAGPGIAADSDRAAPQAASASVASYTRQTLPGSLPSIERDSTVEVITRLGETGPAGAMADPARRGVCEKTIVQRKGDLRAVRRITYDGKAAYVFVFDVAGVRRAYVVDDTCGSTGSLPATVLDTVP
jgi:hypothetical protein